METPNHILFKVIYNQEKVLEIENEILTYLADFSKDKYLEQEKLPRYKEKRLHFTEQINQIATLNSMTIINSQKIYRHFCYSIKDFLRKKLQRRKLP